MFISPRTLFRPSTFHNPFHTLFAWRHIRSDDNDDNGDDDNDAGGDAGATDNDAYAAPAAPIK